MAAASPDVRYISFSVGSPTDAEDLTLWRPPHLVTIVGAWCVLTSGTDITVLLRHDADRSATGTAVFSSGQTVSSTTGGDNLAGFNDRTIDPGSWLWLETSAINGTPAELQCTIAYYIN